MTLITISDMGITQRSYKLAQSISEDTNLAGRVFIKICAGHASKQLCNANCLSIFMRDTCEQQAFAGYINYRAEVLKTFGV